jgi:hypothetical protein
METQSVAPVHSCICENCGTHQDGIFWWADEMPEATRLYLCAPCYGPSAKPASARPNSSGTAGALGRTPTCLTPCCSDKTR